MEFPTIINRNSSFPILGLLGGIFIFIQILKDFSIYKTMESLIRRHVLRRIWFYTVCLCPTKKKLGLYGLKTLEYLFLVMVIDRLHEPIYKHNMIIIYLNLLT